MPELIVTVNKLNKRKAIPSTLSDKDGIIGMVLKGFKFYAEEVAAHNTGTEKWYKDRDGYFYWGGGVNIAGLPDSLQPVDAAKKNQIRNWGIDLYKIDTIWNTLTGANVKIAVLDSGIEINHPDLVEGINDTTDCAFNEITGVKDAVGHGTHCAGIIGARNNNIGVVGVAPNCQLFPGKILNDSYGIHHLYLKKGIQWALEKKANIISMSLGLTSSNEDLKKLVSEATQQHTILIAAAGNNAGGVILNDLLYPAQYEQCISVGAINKNADYDDITVFSDKVDVLAPGRDVFSTCIEPKGYYTYDSGTSMATAFVAGVVALAVEKLQKKGQEINPSIIKNKLIESSDKISVTRDSKQIVFNIINPNRFLSSI